MDGAISAAKFREILFWSVCCFTFSLLHSIIFPEIGRTDLVQYWAGARAVAGGFNPYDPVALRGFEAPYIPADWEVIRLWNPPTILSVVWPAMHVSFDHFADLWFGLSITIFCWCALRLRMLRDGGSRLITALSIATFPPIIESLGYGQLGSFLLLAVTGMLLLFERKRYFLSGLVLSLSAIKPHLLFIVFEWILLEAIYETFMKKRRSNNLISNIATLQLGGLTCGVMLMSGFALLLRGNIWAEYFAAMQDPPIYFFTPTLGAWLEYISGWHGSLIRFLPTALAAAAGVVIYLVGKARYSPVPLAMIIPFSLLFAPYGWIFDQTCILPAVILLSGRSLVAGGLVIFANLLGLLAFVGEGQELGVFYLLFIALLAASEICHLAKENRTALTGV